MSHGKSKAETNHQHFRLLGFDFMLDANLKPWFLEVNRKPNMGGSAPGSPYKSKVMVETFNLLRFHLPSNIPSHVRDQISKTFNIHGKFKFLFNLNFKNSQFQLIMKLLIFN